MIHHLEQSADMRDHQEWHVRVGDDLYVLRASDSESAAYAVADLLGFPATAEDSFDWLRFRSKVYATDLELPDGRSLSADLAPSSFCGEPEEAPAT